MDLISVIVPVYNVAPYLERCVASVLNQTYENLQIILVDDGSTDGSEALCDSISSVDERIFVIHKQNEGLGFARNSGLEVATGKYVTFVDGDDYIGASHIERMYALIENTGTDTCIAGYTKEYYHKRVPHISVCAGKVFRQNIATEILPRMCGADSNGRDHIEMSVCMVLFSNEIIRQNQIRFVSEREYISEDLVFGFDYYPVSKGVCVSNLVDYFYCDNAGSLTTSYREDRFAKQIELYALLKSKAADLGIEDECIGRLQNTVLAIARYSIKLEYKFEKLNGREKTRDNVEKICTNKTLNEIFSMYDDRKNKLTSRVVNFLIRHERCNIIRSIMVMKNIFHE